MKLREAGVSLAQGKPPETTASLGIAGVAQPIRFCNPPAPVGLSRV